MAHRQDGTGPDRKEPKSKIPPTPGYHPAPGQAPKRTADESIPATPGYHPAPKAGAASLKQVPTAGSSSAPAPGRRSYAPAGDDNVTARIPTGRATQPQQAARGGDAPKVGGHSVPPIPPLSKPLARPAGTSAPSRPGRPTGPAPAAPSPQGAPARPKPKAPLSVGSPSDKPQDGAQPASQATPASQPEPARKQQESAEHDPVPAPRIKRPVRPTTVPPYTPPQGSAPAPQDQSQKASAPGADAQPSPAPTPQDEAAATSSRSQKSKRAQREAERAKRNRERDEARQEAAARPSVGVLFAKLSDQVQTLIRGEVQLAKVKAQTVIAKAGAGVALLVAAAILALYMLGVLVHAAVLGLSYAVPDWAAALIVAAILLVLVLILVLVGKSMLTKGLANPPAPQKGIKKDVDAVKKGIGK